jgi:hypothetical protein
MNHPLGLKWKLQELELDQGNRELKDFWEAALENLRRAQAKVAQRYNVGRRQAEFRVGDRVMVRLHPLSSKVQQRSAKLDLR